MLTTARPIFEHVPASFADPAGLADQQAAGVVSLIVAHYGAPPDEGASDDDAPGEDGPLGPTFDTFVAASGALLAVARTTADYRFPVTPAAALARFYEHRDAARPASLSLFELSEPDCARFLETVFYSECLKLHVRGTASAALVADQVARSGCRRGVIEFNDFSDPAAPRVHLLDLDGPELGPLLDAAADADDDDARSVALAALAGALAVPLDGLSGRVLLYDRAKNRAALPDRTGRAFDLDAVAEQATRLAEARRFRPPQPTPGDVPLVSTARDDAQADAVETLLHGHAAPREPLSDSADASHAAGLSALVAELQGGRTPRALPAPGRLDAPPLAPDVLPPFAPFGDAPPGDAPALTPAVSHLDGWTLGHDPLAPPAPGTAPAPSLFTPPPGPSIPPLISSPPSGPGSPGLIPYPPSPPPPAAPRHPLATELDRLRAEVYALFEDAVGGERAALHEAHVLQDAGIASPVAATDSVRYLRALLTDEPPQRWHFFKRARARIYGEVAGRLLAFHAANGHLDDPVVLDVTRLWTRLHK